MSQVEIIKEKIKNVDFNFIRYIRDETKAYGNKVIFLSFATILLCLEIVKIQELQLEGIKVDIKPYVLILLVCIINLYYFLQFLNSIKIDILVTKLPNEITEIFELIEELRKEKQLKIDNLSIEIQKAKDNSQFDLETKNLLKAKQADIKENEYFEVYEKWIKISGEFLNHHKRNMFLNFYFPIVFFVIAIASFVYKLYWA